MAVPSWRTPEGFLSTVTERTYVNIPLVTNNSCTVSVISGSLPTGLSLSNIGRITGYPASTGGTTRTQFVVRASNVSGITDRTFIIDTQGLSNLTWITPEGWLNLGFGKEYYVINKEYVDFQFQANPGQILAAISSNLPQQVNTIYLDSLLDVDTGQPGTWRQIGGYGIQAGTTITNISSSFNPTFNGYEVGISLPTTEPLSTGSNIVLYDSLPQGQTIKFYVEEGSGQLPPGLILSPSGHLTGYVYDNLGLDYQVSSTGGYDDEKYDGYPYDHGTLYNGKYLDQVYQYIPKIYQFSITASDGVTAVKRDFKTIIVDPRNLLGDGIATFASGILAAESGYLIAPTWLGPTGYPVSDTAVVPTQTLNATIDQATVNVGQTAQILATALFTDGNIFDVTANSTYIANNASIATVNSVGQVTAISTGVATFTVRFRGRTAAVSLSVVVPVLGLAALDLIPGPISLAIGDTQQLTAIAIFPSGTETNVTNISDYISSGAPTTVNSTGLVTGATSGVDNISASYLGLTATVVATVATPNLSIIELTSPYSTSTYGASVAYGTDTSVYMSVGDSVSFQSYYSKIDTLKGNIVWQKSFSESINWPSITVDCLTRSGDYIYFTQQSSINTGDILFKCALDGTIIWSADIGGNSAPCQDIGVNDQLGHVYVITVGGLLIVNSSTGSGIFYMEVPANCPTLSIAVDSVNYYIYVAAGTYLYQIAWDSIPYINWQYDVGNNSGFDSSVAVGSDGIYLATRILAADGGLFLIKFDSSGTIIWSRTFTGPYYGLFTISVSLCLDSDNNSYITAITDQYTITICSLDSSGNDRWANSISINDFSKQFITVSNIGYLQKRPSNSSRYTSIGGSNKLAIAVQRTADTTGTYQAILFNFPIDGTSTGTHGIYDYYPAGVTSSNYPASYTTSGLSSYYSGYSNNIIYYEPTYTTNILRL